jgi:Toprim domain
VNDLAAGEIARTLARRVDQLVKDLLPAGHREGGEWRTGNVQGDQGSSLSVRLSGQKAGLWNDFASGESGDALDLVRAALDVDMPAALGWSRRWLGLKVGGAALPNKPAPKPEPEPDPDRWKTPWQRARPIAGSLAETYLAERGRRLDDPTGRVLRFAARRGRKSLEDKIEHHPALLAALSDARSGEQCGIINIYLKPDGSDRLRDKKGKTVTGRAGGAVVMLSAFDESTMGLVLCEGVETGIALFQDEMRPVWACGAAGTLRKFPVLGAIEALTTGADPDKTGIAAANELAGRWRAAGREVLIIAPTAGDWDDPR